jgi:Spy/CpxP family protein refolding chaperone
MKTKHIAAMLSVVMVGLFSAVALHAADADATSNVGKKAEPGQRFERLDGVLSKLNLTPDQKSKIDAIIADAVPKLREARQSIKAGGDREAVRAKVKQLMLDTRGKIMEVLTADQKAQLKANLKELRQSNDRPKRLRGGAATKPAV